jgi:hypothetical protein
MSKNNNIINGVEKAHLICEIISWRRRRNRRRSAAAAAWLERKQRNMYRRRGEMAASKMRRRGWRNGVSMASIGWQKRHQMVKWRKRKARENNENGAEMESHQSGGMKWRRQRKRRGGIESVALKYL